MQRQTGPERPNVVLSPGVLAEEVAPLGRNRATGFAWSSIGIGIKMPSCGFAKAQGSAVTL